MITLTKFFKTQKTSAPSRSKSPQKSTRSGLRVRRIPSKIVEVWEFPCVFLGSFCAGFRICKLTGEDVLKQDCEDCTIWRTWKVKITIMEPTPLFVGLDGRVYGPFEVGEVVEVPVGNAWAIVMGGFGEVLEEVR